MSSIITEKDIKLENQIERCKAMVRKYFNEQCLSVDYGALYRKLDPPSLLFQFAHMIAFHKMHWQDALRWVVINRDNILAYAEGRIDEWGNIKLEQADATAIKAD